VTAFEDRLREDLRATAAAVDVVPPPAASVLAAASGRRERRLTGAASGMALVLLLTITATLASQEIGGDDELVVGPRRLAEMATEYAPTTTSPSAVQTTTVTVPVPTTARPSRPALVAPTTTAPVTTTTTTDPRPLSQRVPHGLWVVGLDGNDLRRIGDVGRHSWSPDASTIAVATDRIWLLSATDGHAVATIESGGPVSCLDWSSKGTLGWVTADGTIRYARPTDRSGSVVATGTPVQLSGYDDGCRWSPDGSLFATSGEGFVLFDVAGRRVEVAEHAAVASTSGVKWSPDGSSIAAIARDSDGRRTTVAILSGAAWTVIDEVPGSAAALRIVWAVDGKRLLMRETYKLTSYDVESEVTAVETTQGFSVLTPLAGGDHLTVGPGDAVRFLSSSWEPRGVLLTAEAFPNQCAGSFFTSMRVSPDGRRLAVEAQPQGGGWRCDKMRAS
jgi:dipeptidyl aminopeptidase/acylaminoacyl peptidase